MFYIIQTAMPLHNLYHLNKTLLAFQIYWVTISTLVGDINKLQSETIEVHSALDREIFAIQTAIGTDITDEDKAKSFAAINKLNDDALDNIENIDAQIISDYDLLKKINFFSLIVDEKERNKNVIFNKSASSILLKTGTVSMEIMSLYVLPILYGYWEHAPIFYGRFLIR